jgi:hypothetical protein
MSIVFLITVYMNGYRNNGCRLLGTVQRWEGTSPLQTSVLAGHHWNFWTLSSGVTARYKITHLLNPSHRIFINNLIVTQLAMIFYKCRRFFVVCADCSHGTLYYLIQTKYSRTVSSYFILTFSFSLHIFHSLSIFRSQFWTHHSFPSWVLRAILSTTKQWHKKVPAYFSSSCIPFQKVHSEESEIIWHMDALCCLIQRRCNILDVCIIKTCVTFIVNG